VYERREGVGSPPLLGMYGGQASLAVVFAHSPLHAWYHAHASNWFRLQLETRGLCALHPETLHQGQQSLVASAFHCHVEYLGAAE
jgi:hypothetical protein